MSWFSQVQRLLAENSIPSRTRTPDAKFVIPGGQDETLDARSEGQKGSGHTGAEQLIRRSSDVGNRKTAQKCGIKLVHTSQAVRISMQLHPDIVSGRRPYPDGCTSRDACEDSSPAACLRGPAAPLPGLSHTRGTYLRPTTAIARSWIGEMENGNHVKSQLPVKVVSFYQLHPGVHHLCTLPRIRAWVRLFPEAGRAAATLRIRQ